MTSVGEGVEKREPLYTAGVHSLWNVKWSSHHGGWWYGGSSNKLKPDLIYDPAIHIGIYIQS